MYRKVIGFLIVPAMVWSLCLAGLSGCKKSATAAEPQKPAKTYAGETEAEHIITGEPDRWFQEARRDFVAGDYDGSAKRIREAAKFIRSCSKNSLTGEGQTAIIKSANALDSLADRVQKGTIRPVRELEDCFAWSHYALSRNYFLNAILQRQFKRMSRLARSFRASAMHMKTSYAWARQPAPETTLAVIQNTERVANRLEQGLSTSDNEIGRVLDNLSTETEKLKEVVEPLRPETSPGM